MFFFCLAGRIAANELFQLNVVFFFFIKRFFMAHLTPALGWGSVIENPCNISPPEFLFGSFGHLTFLRAKIIDKLSNIPIGEL